MPSKSPICSCHHFFPISSHMTHNLVLWMGEREMSSFGSIPYQWRSHVLMHTCSFSSAGEITGYVISLGRKLCCLRVGVMQVKSSHLSYSLHCVQTCTFLFQQCAETSLGVWISAKVFLSIDDCLRLWLRGAGASWWVIASSIAVTEIYLPITQHTGRQASSQVPWHMVESHSSHKGTLYACWGRMLKFYLEGKDKYKECHVFLWYWHHFLLFSLETCLKQSLLCINISYFLELCLANGRHSNVTKDESKFQKVEEVFNLQNQMPLCTYINIYCNILMCKLIQV